MNFGCYCKCWWWARTWCLCLKVTQTFKQLQTVKDRPNSPASAFTLKQACEDSGFCSFLLQMMGAKLNSSETAAPAASVAQPLKKAKPNNQLPVLWGLGEAPGSWTLFGHSSGGPATQGWRPEASEHTVTHACAYARTICNSGKDCGNYWRRKTYWEQEIMHETQLKLSWLLWLTVTNDFHWDANKS